MRWARAYVEFAAGEKRSWLAGHGLTFLPTVGWAERGDLRADGHGNSVPRFHVAWGTGTGVVEPFVRSARRRRPTRGLLTVPPPAPGRRAGRHGRRGDRRTRHASCAGRRLAARRAVQPGRRRATSSCTAQAVDRHHRRHRRQPRPRPPLLAGAARHGRRRRWSPACRRTSTGGCSTSAPSAGARLVNRDRMWHYTEGLQNWDPIWPGHGIRILPGPSSMWFDALGRRLPDPCLPGYDTLGTLRVPAHHPGPRRARPLLVRPHPEDHREGVRAVGLGAEPGHHQPGTARPSSRERVLGKGAPAPVEALQAARRGLRRRRHPRGARRRR